MKKIRRTHGYTNAQLIVVFLVAFCLNLFLMLIETGELLEAMSIIHIVIGVILSFLAVDLKEELWDSDEDKILSEALITGMIVAFPLSLFLPYVWSKLSKVKDLINRI